MWKFEKAFRRDNPQTLGETDKRFDLDNYKDWLEDRLDKEINKNLSKKVNLIINFLKKNNCTIDSYWYCGIPQFKVVIDEQRKNYPRINEDTWIELKPYLLKVKGEYQTCETWELYKY